VLIPKYSLIGAAIGTAIAEASVLCGMALGLRRAGAPLPRCPNAPKVLLAGVTGAGSIWLMSHLGSPWAVSLIVGGNVYVALLALTGAIPRDLAANLLRRPRASDAL
jgi:O-antigen/teichoic acid export membrane protein